MAWICRCPGIVWEPIRKQAHTQLFREHSATVVSALWASVDWSWPKEWNQCAPPDLHFKKKAQTGSGWSNILPKSSQARKSHCHACQMYVLKYRERQRPLFHYGYVWRRYNRLQQCRVTTTAIPLQVCVSVCISSNTIRESHRSFTMGMFVGDIIMSAAAIQREKDRYFITGMRERESRV